MTIVNGITDHWSLEVDAVDQIGLSTGALQGTASFAGSAAVFPGGSGNYISIPATHIQPNGDTTSSFSVKVRVFPTAVPPVGGYGAIIAEPGDAWGLYFKTNGSVSWWSFTAGGDHASAAGACPLSTWTDVIFTFNGATGAWKMYIDGTVSGSGTNLGISAYGLTKIGGYSTPSPLSFIGKMNHLTGWRRELSPAEVTFLQTAGDFPYGDTWTLFSTEDMLDEPPLTVEIPFEDVFEVIPGTPSFCSELDFPSRGSVYDGIFDVSAVSSSAFDLLSVTAFADRLELAFGANIEAVGIASLTSSWTITNGVGAPIPTITSISVLDKVITLYTSEARDGTTYTLGIPFTGINDLSHNPYIGPFTHDYVGVGVKPTVSLAGAQDGFHVKVIFSEPVVVAEALTPSNYVITGGSGLSVFEVTQETAQVFILRTSLQVVGQSYTVTVNNIHDLLGNLI